MWNHKIESRRNRRLLRRPDWFAVPLALFGLFSLVQIGNSQSVNYEDNIKPIFRKHCLTCHNEDDKEADIDLSSYAATIKGGSSGAIVKAGRPQNSTLFIAINHGENVEAMPPEGEKLSDNEIKIIDSWIRTGLIEGKGGKSQLRSIELVTPNGNTIVSPMPAGLPKETAKTARPPVPQSVAASPGALLVAISGQEQVLFYGKDKSKPDSGFKLIGCVPYKEGAIHDLAFNGTGTILLVAGGRGAYSGKVVLFEVTTGKRIGELGDEVDSVLAADISSDNRFVAIGNSSKTVKVFDSKQGKLIHRIKKHTDWITSISFSPDGKFLATGDRSGGLYVWESETGSIAYTLDEHKQPIKALSWRSDSRVLASGAEDGNVVLWDMKDGFPIRNVKAHAEKSKSRYTRKTGVLSIDFTKDGGLVTAGRDGKIKLWNADGAIKSSMSVGDSLVTQAKLLSTNLQVIVGTIDGQLHLIDLDKKERTQSLKNGQE